MAELKSNITAVTIYPDRVRLTRRGSIKLEAGTRAIELPELPLTIHPDSIRASVFGSKSARLLGVEIRKDFYVDQPSGAVRDMEEDIQKKQDELKRLDAKLELIRQNRANLDKLAGQANIYATALAAGEMNAEQQLEFLGKLRKQSEKLDDETITVQANQRKVERQLEALEKELEQLQNQTPHERYKAVVHIEATSASSLTLEVSYVVSGAGWRPLYDLRLVEKEGYPTLEVTYLADVTQSTGEDWKEVSLTLSTAQPAVAASLPELDPWYIHPPEPVYPAARLNVSMPAPLAVPEKPAMLAKLNLQAEPEEKAEEVTALVSTAGASVSYLIPEAVSIPSGGSSSKVTIARFNLTPVVDYVTTPKLAQSVFRRARVENDSPYTLLPGEANILIADEYVGTSKLDLTVSGGVIELYLGSDNRLKVERELKRREVDKRMIGGKRSLAYGYEIKLESMLPNRANVTVYDQLPVSRNEDIKVRLESAEPRPSEQTELNQLVWNLLVEPKQKIYLRFDFNIESPQAMKIIGLP